MPEELPGGAFCAAEGRAGTGTRLPAAGLCPEGCDEARGPLYELRPVTAAGPAVTGPQAGEEPACYESQRGPLGHLTSRRRGSGGGRLTSPARRWRHFLLHLPPVRFRFREVPRRRGEEGRTRWRRLAWGSARSLAGLSPSSPLPRPPPIGPFGGGQPIGGPQRREGPTPGQPLGGGSSRHVGVSGGAARESGGTPERRAAPAAAAGGRGALYPPPPSGAAVTAAGGGRRRWFPGGAVVAAGTRAAAAAAAAAASPLWMMRREAPLGWVAEAAAASGSVRSEAVGKSAAATAEEEEAAAARSSAPRGGRASAGCWEPPRALVAPRGKGPPGAERGLPRTPARFPPSLLSPLPASFSPSLSPGAASRRSSGGSGAEQLLPVRLLPRRRGSAGGGGRWRGCWRWMKWSSRGWCTTSTPASPASGRSWEPVPTAWGNSSYPLPWGEGLRGSDGFCVPTGRLGLLGRERGKELTPFPPSSSLCFLFILFILFLRLPEALPEEPGPGVAASSPVPAGVCSARREGAVSPPPAPGDGPLEGRAGWHAFALRASSLP